MKTEY